jgi:DNA repair protein RecN (Recombination protein N)
MLRELRIKNLAIIDDITVEFEKGMNVLTGETGAGKSIVVDALCLALGERASSELVRSGEKEAVIEAFFDIPRRQINISVRRLLQDIGIDFDEGVVMKRIITTQGKSRAYINDSMVNVQTLSDVSSGFIDVHGQYEHQSLLSSDNQIDMLDAYGGFLPERQEVTEAYERQLSLKRQIAELAEKEKERERRTDMLKYQISEIGAAGLKAGEDAELTEEAGILGNAARLAELASRAYESLYSSDRACITSLSEILASLKEISNIDARAGDALKTAEGALPLLEETAYFLRDYKEGLNFSPERLDEIQERIELIRGLKRKYGGSIQEVINYRENAAEELNELEHSGEKMESLNSELREARGILTEKAGLLSKKRREVSRKIEQKVISSLSQLAMAGTRFSISIACKKGDSTDDGFSANPKGIDDVEYLISPNIGEALKPLSKIASGGELSRTMLALKGTMAKADKIPTLIFDEIDAGVGGKAAESVGQKLRDLSSGHQTICITHLPQIASYADTQLRIEKRIKNKRTVVFIEKVEKAERVKEIARMLSGDGSEVSIKHAKELLKKNAKVKV